MSTDDQSNCQHSIDCREFTSYTDFNDRVDRVLSDIDIGVKLPKTTRGPSGKCLTTRIVNYRPLDAIEISNLQERDFVLPVVTEHDADQIPPLSVIEIEIVDLVDLHSNLADDPTSIDIASLNPGINSRAKLRIETYYDLRNVPSVATDELHRLLRRYLAALKEQKLGRNSVVLNDAITTLRANLTPEKMPNFMQQCTRKDAEEMITRSQSPFIWRRSNFKGGLFYYRESGHSHELVKAQDSYAVTYIVRSGRQTKIYHYLCEKIIGEGYYFSGGRYENQQFIISKRQFYPMFLDLLESLLNQVQIEDIDRI
jgi:hypothetical protein